jgi:dUTP pyrophosphatase
MKILRTRDVKTPNRGTSQSAGIDIFIPNEFETTMIKPGESAFIPAGIKADVPEGHALIAMNKSGVAVKKKCIVGACVIDEDYQGEIHIDIKNIGSEPVILKAGEKITQLLCIPINYVDVEEVSSEAELFNGEVTERGTGGFGSTGTK